MSSPNDFYEISPLRNKFLNPLIGETELFQVDAILDFPQMNLKIEHGTLVITNYKLSYVYEDEGVNTEENTLVPLSCIHKINDDRYGALEIKTRDGRLMKITIESNNKKEIVCWLEKNVFWKKNGMRMSDCIFAFKHKREYYQPYSSEDESGTMYIPEEEFKRQKIQKDNFIISDINQNYKLCDTYPKKIIVPKMDQDEYLNCSAMFRSSNRLPVVCFVHPEKKSVLARCSQPLAGVTFQESKEDAKIVSCMHKETKSQENTKLKIVDLRSKFAARCNYAIGGGHENLEYYPNCELEFMDIYNIHCVRKSFRAMIKLYQDTCDPDRDAIEKTEWLLYLKAIIKTASSMAASLTQGRSVLVHCSDGWDRTPQATSLTQLLIDPYFRTIKGFGVLIQKEWLAFGHKFEERLGLGEPEDTSHEESPIFMQFIDAVYQLLCQFPNWFEFNECYLIELLDQLYSGRFGTFLLNSEKEREESDIAASTLSVWPWLLENQILFKNPEYVWKDTFTEELKPPTGTSHLQVWTRYYLRYKASMRQRHLHNQQSLKNKQNCTKLVAENQQLKEKVNKCEELLMEKIKKDPELCKALVEELKKVDTEGLNLESLKFTLEPSEKKITFSIQRRKSEPFSPVSFVTKNISLNQIDIYDDYGNCETNTEDEYYNNLTSSDDINTNYVIVNTDDVVDTFEVHQSDITPTITCTDPFETERAISILHHSDNNSTVNGTKYYPYLPLTSIFTVSISKVMEWLKLGKTLQ